MIRYLNTGYTANEREGLLREVEQVKSLVYANNIVGSPFNGGSSAVTTPVYTTLNVGFFSDKAGARRGFQADPNDNWAQQAEGTAATINKYGRLDNTTVNLDSTDHQVTAFSHLLTNLSFSLLHPDQSQATGALPQSLFTSITIDGTTFNSADATVQAQASGNSGFKITTWFWVAANPFGTTTGADLVFDITE